MRWKTLLFIIAAIGCTLCSSAGTFYDTDVAVDTIKVDTKSLDSEFAGLFASPGSTSQRNAERNGFGLIYTKAIMKLEQPK